MDLTAEICSNSVTRALVRSSADWAIRPGSQLAFHFIIRVLDGVEVRALCRPVKFFHIKLGKLFLDATLMSVR